MTEFAAAELGARIGRTTSAAARLMADALDLHHRLPQLWARVEALVAGKAAQADPETARAKEEQASRATFAKKLRPTLADQAHGMGSYLVRADLATIDALDATVQARASRLVESMPDADDDTRRVHAVLRLATGAPDDTPIDQLLPTVTLYVHTYASPDTTPDAEPVLRVEGHGPVTDTWVRRVLGPRAKFKIQPVLDLAGQAPVDAYEIPDRHRQAVHLMTPADTFPWGSSLSPRQQVDHNIPHDRGGLSGVGNYGPMTTTHHRIKTHGGWQVRQPFPGIYLWRDRHGAFYLTDHTGTRRLPRPTPARARPRVVEIYRELRQLQLAA